MAAWSYSVIHGPRCVPPSIPPPSPVALCPLPFFPGRFLLTFTLRIASSLHLRHFHFFPLHVPPASLSLAIVLSTLAALPILLLCVLSLQIQTSSTSSYRLFHTSLFNLHLVSGIASAWTSFAFLFQAFPPSLPLPILASARLPPSHYPILVLSLLTLIRASMGCLCHSSPPSVSRTFSFLLLVCVLGVYLLNPLLCWSAARMLTGRRELVSSLLFVLGLALVLGGVGEFLRHGGRKGEFRCTPTGGREGGRGGEILLLAVCGLSALVSLRMAYWGSEWPRARETGQREGGPAEDRVVGEEEGEGTAHGQTVSEMGVEEAGVGLEAVRVSASVEASAPSSTPLRKTPSRRSKLLISFVSLSMSITSIRSILDLLPSFYSSSASFLFLDLAVFALIAPVVWCLYGLDSELVIFQALRWGGRRMVQFLAGSKDALPASNAA